MVIKSVSRQECDKTLNRLTGPRIYDTDPRITEIYPGALPTDTDPQLDVPVSLPAISQPNRQERFDQTPIYASLT
jgi:hypothetical protein